MRGVIDEGIRGRGRRNLVKRIRDETQTILDLWDLDESVYEIRDILQVRSAGVN